MADTDYLSIPANDWVSISAIVGDIALVTNIGERTLTWVRSVTKPDADFKDGHHLFCGQPLDYALEPGESLWMRAQHFNGRIAVTMGMAISTRLHDGNGNPLSSYYNAVTNEYVLDVHDADVHNIPANDFVHRHGTTTTLAAAAAAGVTSITLTDTTDFVVGVYVHMGPTTESLEPIHPQVTDVVGNVVSLDRPLDFSYANGEDVSVSIVNLVTGSIGASLAAPVVYRYRPHSGRVEHITRLLFQMIHPSAGSDDKFGGITALPNGVALRASVSGNVGTFTNWKNNGDIRLDMYDVDYSDKVGAGDFGTSGRGSFNRIGVVIRLDPAQGDYVEVSVQDDLATPGMIDYRIKLQGHAEEG